MNNSSENTKILKNAISEIQNGEKKDIIFKSYKDKVDPNILATKMAMYPDKSLLESRNIFFKFFSLLLSVYIGLLIIGVIRKIITETPKVSVIISMIISILIYLTILNFSLKKHFMSFRFAFIFCIRGLFSIIKNLETIVQHSPLNRIYYLLIFIMGLTIIVLSLVINKKCYPHMKFFRPFYHKEGGPMYRFYPEENGI